MTILAQKQQDSVKVYKKRVLNNAEIGLLTSVYTQDGNNAAVTGGMGSEKLYDIATNINILIPVKEDNILSIDGTVSAYSSASSSNLDPFFRTVFNGESKLTGTPWVESSGASASDVWGNVNVGGSHYSDSRDDIYKANIHFSSEYDYISFGSDIGVTKLLNKKNTELSIGASVFLDTWNPQYPKEIKTYKGDLSSGFFNGVEVYNDAGLVIDKSSANAWKPLRRDLIKDKNRNTYSLSLSCSQILNRNTQVSVFSDITYQNGWLANPMQRVYFADRNDFYVGNSSEIPNYSNPSSQGVFQLADDIERLPSSRLKIPIGIRLNYFVNEFLVVRTYYRYYFDDWGIQSNTFNVELPIKIGGKFTVYPSYRFYNQTATDYFAPFEKHLSTDKFYTSDYDLSKIIANQLGMGVKYTDVFLKSILWNFGLKNITLNYNYYRRNNGIRAHILSLGTHVIFK